MHNRIICPDYEYGQITPSIGVGPLPPIGKPLSKYFSDLVLCSESYQPHRDCFPGMKVYNCPLRDDLVPFTPPVEQMIYETVLNCVQSLKNGGRVLFTCHSGYNRSALVACLSAMNVGYAVPDFMNRIKSIRGHNALSNPMFCQYLYDRM